MPPLATVQWSKYNFMFQSARFGFFLYNSLSNALIWLDTAHYAKANALGTTAKLCAHDSASPFFQLLRQCKVVVENGEEHAQLELRRRRRDALTLNETQLSLSICPTLACNFRCPYCYENTQRRGVMMSAQTIERVVRFIKHFEKAETLSITWYGGEPTLAFSTIVNLTKRIQSLDLRFLEAGLVTNGYLLGSEEIGKLNDLNIRTVQVTLDGPQAVHDTRRVLANGRPTYERILQNIDALLNSSYKGTCYIRVNIDRKNLATFFELRSHLLDRFKGKNCSVYAGHVDARAGMRTSDSTGCSLCAEEWREFTIAQFRDRRVPTNEGIYPIAGIFNVCSANTKCSFVIGPEGELYKCWEDVGKKTMSIGSVWEDNPITKPDLVTLYGAGTDPYLDAECSQCVVLPICGGGCANRRLRARHFGERGLHFCSLYKDNLAEYLVEYYDAFLTSELSRKLLTPGHARSNTAEGYRLVRHCQNTGACATLKN